MLALMKLTPTQTVTKKLHNAQWNKKKQPYSICNNEKEWDEGNDTNLRVLAKTSSYKRWKDDSIRHSVEVTIRRASIGEARQNNKQEKHLSIFSRDTHSQRYVGFREHLMSIVKMNVKDICFATGWPLDASTTSHTNKLWEWLRTSLLTLPCTFKMLKQSCKYLQ